MQKIINNDPGLCLAFGATNARRAECAGEQIHEVTTEGTASSPHEFMQWLAKNALDTFDEGASKWVVAGFPGPVKRTEDGSDYLIGPFKNVSGMSDRPYRLFDEMANADSAVTRLLDQGATIIAVNDGELAAQAVARTFDRGDEGVNTFGALIVGTGIGAGVVERDARFANVYRAVDLPLEVGHQTMLTASGITTFEDMYSGTAASERFGLAPEDLPENHQYWKELGRAIGVLSLNIGLTVGVDLVVPTGGVGAGASGKYREFTEEILAKIIEDGENQTQIDLMPKLRFIDPKKAHHFELTGAVPVYLDHITKD